MASYTSVSLMSTSAWDNAGGCPVVSPSVWNPIVASNLCVLSLHNHSGSAGEGVTTPISSSQFPTMDVQYIWPWFPTLNTCWTPQVASYWPGLGCMATSSIGAVLEYDVYLKRNNANGEVWQLDFFVSGGSVDGAPDGGALAGSLGGMFIEFAGPGYTLDLAGRELPQSPTTASFTLDGATNNITACITTRNRSASSTTGSPNEGIGGHGRTKLRFKTMPSYSGSGNEVRIGFIKVQRTQV